VSCKRSRMTAIITPSSASNGKGPRQTPQLFPHKLKFVSTSHQVGLPAGRADCEVWLLREGDEALLAPRAEVVAFKSANRSFWDYPPQGPPAIAEENTGDEFDVRAANVIDLAEAWMARALDVAGSSRPLDRFGFGYTLLGTPPRSGCDLGFTCGYELDLLKTASADANFETVVKLMIEAAGSQAGKAFSSVHIAQPRIRGVRARPALQLDG